ncbi:MAG: ribosome maturation factor RimM [Christensenellales bacterium]
MDKITIGTISRPQGIRGELKVYPLTDDLLRFKKLTSVYVADKKYGVKSVRVSAKDVFLTLEGIDDRNMAEQLRNADVKVDRKDAVQLPDDRYFIVDIIGCDVMTDGEKIGKIKDVLQYGSADVYVIDCVDGRESMIPAIDRMIKSVDVQAKKIVVDKQAYKDLALYED